VVSRVHTTLHQLHEEHAGETVVVVAHGFIAKTIRALARQDFSDFYQWQLGNGSVLTLESVQAPAASPQSWELQLPTT
jgi:probable phosphoglycerate mutase